MARNSALRMGICGTLSALALVAAGSAALSLRADAAAEDAGYRLMEYSGRVAVFSGSDSSPITVTDIETRLLPELDRSMLESGIRAETQSELEALLEDLGS